MNTALIMLIGPSVAIAVGAIIGIFIFFRNRGRHKKPTTTTVQEASALAFVYQNKAGDSKSKSRILDRVPLSQLEHLGSIRRRLGNKLIHLIEVNKAGHKQAFSLDQISKDKNITPSDLYGAIHWKTQVALFKVEPSTLQKIKVAILIALAAIVLLGLFLIAAAMFSD
jgi:hypothetical protein